MKRAVTKVSQSTMKIPLTKMLGMEDSERRTMDELIRKQDALDAIHCNITVTGRQNAELVAATIGAFADRIKALPPVQPTNEMVERCRFEYIHACKIVSIPTPDVTGKDIQDAYAVIKALQPIFGDVPFAKVKRGDSGGTD